MKKKDNFPKKILENISLSGHHLINILWKNYNRLIKIILIAALLFILPPTLEKKTIPQTEKINPSHPTLLSLPVPPLYPVNNTGKYPLYLTGEGIIVEDLNSGVILYQKNSDIRFSPASTTKIMAALVAANYYQPEDILTVKTVDRGGSNMGLITGEKLTFESLLYGLLIQSANDAAVTIAENYPGGLEGFVKAMNQNVENLHLLNTHFTNPVGYDNSNHYTTPSDLARITTVALRNQYIAKIGGTRSITVSDISYTYFHDLKNVNQLLGEIPGVAGLKTGYTENAEECLVTLVKRNNNNILIVLLRSGDRFKETAYLINWVFSNYHWVNVQN